MQIIYMVGQCLKNCLFNEFKWIKDPLSPDKKLNKLMNLIENYDEDSDKGYIFEINVEYPKDLHDLHSDLPLLPERMKINKSNKFMCNLYDKNNHVIHIRSLKQALNNGLILKKVYRVIEFNQEACLKKYIDMKTELRKKANIDFEKDLCKLMNNPVFRKTMENVRNHRYIRLTTNTKRNQLVSDPNYHTTKWFFESLIAIEMKKIKVIMNKPIYLGLSIYINLDIQVKY